MKDELLYTLIQAANRGINRKQMALEWGLPCLDGLANDIKWLVVFILMRHKSVSSSSSSRKCWCFVRHVMNSLSWMMTKSTAFSDVHLGSQINYL